MNDESTVLFERFEDTIRNRKSKKDRQSNGQMKKDKALHRKQNRTIAPLKTASKLRCSGRVSKSCFPSDTVVLFLNESHMTMDMFH